MNLRAMNVAGMWSAVTATAAVMVYLFNNLAWAADIQRIEANQLRAEVRNLCYKYQTAPDRARGMVGGFVMEAVDDLCSVDDSSRYCDDDTPEEVCD